jgi:hypothetical protein
MVGRASFPLSIWVVVRRLGGISLFDCDKLITRETATAVGVCLIFLSTMAMAAGADYKVVKTGKLGSDGGWDYLTADSDGHQSFPAPIRRFG